MSGTTNWFDIGVSDPPVPRDSDAEDEADEQRDRIRLAALDQPGPWPATVDGGPSITVLDVDRLGEWAAVLASETDQDDDTWLMTSLYRQVDDEWRFSHGAGSGHPDGARSARREPAVTVFASGPGRGLGHATLVCGERVASLQVQRPDHPRAVDVSAGPGCVVIVWLAGSEPAVVAFDADGAEIGRLSPDAFQR